MTFDEKKEWYIKHGYKSLNGYNPSVLMPDGTYYWLLSEKDIRTELLRADGGGD